MARIVVIGAGAAGIAAATTAKQFDRSHEVTLIGDQPHTAYSPCGIPYVFGREVKSFDDLFLQKPEFYTQEMGLDLHLSTSVERIDWDGRVVEASGGKRFPFDKLILCTGWQYIVPDIPGVDLKGVYFIKDIATAREIDKEIDAVEAVLVWKGRPIGLELATALAHRGKQVYLVDDEPWLLAEFADPDIMEVPKTSLEQMGVQILLSTRLLAIEGQHGRVAEAITDKGEFAVQMAFMAADMKPAVDLATSIGVKLGSTGGIVVDDMMQTNVPGVYAAGSVVETPHAVAGVPVRLMQGTYAYTQGRVAGANAAGDRRRYRAVYVPWAMEVGKTQVGGVLLTETLAKALGREYVVGEAKGLTAARYHPKMEPMRVKLLADPKTREVIGAQFAGGDGLKERADFLAFAMRKHATVDELATMENVYSPPIGALNEPIALAAQNALAKLDKR
ncbi:MAG TPA: FAD-dependent oxidoreductase [Chloroflexota bacterium]